MGLKLLDVSWNGFGDEGAKELGEALKTSTLQTLDLTCNRVGAEGFIALLKGVKDNYELQNLKVSLQLYSISDMLSYAFLCICRHQIL